MKYTIALNTEKTARASARDAPISTKFCVEYCRQIRYKNIQKAKQFVEDVINQRRALPLLVHNKKTAHKPNIGAGRYPIKAGKAILELLISVEKNAIQKGLDADSLKIVHTNAHQASRPMHAGRQRRRLMKRTHVEIIVQEKAKQTPKKQSKTPKTDGVKEKSTADTKGKGKKKDTGERKTQDLPTIQANDKQASKDIQIKSDTKEPTNDTPNNTSTEVKSKTASDENTPSGSTAE